MGREPMTALADNGTGEHPPAAGVRLAILEPSRLFRESLAQALAEPGRFEVVLAAERAEEIAAHLPVLQPQVLVSSDLGSRGDTLELLRRLHGALPALPLLVLGHEEADSQVIGLLEAGAIGFVSLDQSLCELRAAIEAVAQGTPVYPPRLAGSLFSRLAGLGRQRRRREKLDFLRLTPRELEILRLIADGFSNEEIARRLFLSIHTVKNHIHKVLETLGVHSRWDAVRLAAAKGWLPAGGRAERGLSGLASHH